MRSDARACRAGITLIAIAGGLLLLVAPLRAQQPRERQLYVSVLDKNGDPVSGLRPADFIVREDGVAREVLRVNRVTTPMQMALVVDTSQAAEEHVSELRKGLQALIQSLEGPHEFTLITFGDRPTIVVNPTTDRAALLAAIDRLFASPAGGQMLLEAVVETSRGFEKREAMRPVIVVVAMENGVEFSPNYSETVLEALARSRAAMYSVVLTDGRPSDRDETRNRDIVLGAGPERTGGRRITVLIDTAFANRFTQLAAELTNQYLVVYGRPETLIPPKEIRVSARQADLTARGTPVPVPPR